MSVRSLVWSGRVKYARAALLPCHIYAPHPPSPLHAMACNEEVTVLEQQVPADIDAGQAAMRGDETNLYAQIDRDKIFGLNLADPEHAATCIKPWDRREDMSAWTESGVDDQVRSARKRHGHGRAFDPFPRPSSSSRSPSLRPSASSLSSSTSGAATLRRKGYAHSSIGPMGSALRRSSRVQAEHPVPTVRRPSDR